MITATQIKGGEGYMKSHLSANDYYSEGEKVTGHWQGEVAKMLGIEGEAVTKDAFEALRTNKHPLTGEKLRSRNGTVAYHDIVVSCPKTMSIAAMAGQDERLVEAFKDVVEKTFKSLEAHASRRDRKAGAYNTENTINTGNAVAAVFHHDTSRMLDPQLHAHMVCSNHTWCEAEGQGQWFALQPRKMLEESKASIRQAFYRDMASECQKLGYDVEWKYDADQEQSVPRLSAISPEMELLYSQRKQQKQDFIERYTATFGHKPDMRRVEYFIKETKGPATKRFAAEYEEVFGRKAKSETITALVKDWRSSKMADSTQEEVLAGQLKRMNSEQSQQLQQTVKAARMKQAGNTHHLLKPKYESPKLSVVAASELKVKGKRKRKVSQRQSKQSSHRKALVRADGLRKLRRGAAILRALNGNPTGFIARELVRATRKR